MIKISEFTPSINSNREHTNTASCKVVINNTNSPQTDIENNTEDKPVEQPVASPTIPMVMPVAYVPETDAANAALYKHLALAFSSILKNNNPKLIANLIDQSGKVILAAADLVTAISLMLGVDSSVIVISYEDPEAGCLGRVSPIKRITAIKINGYDFNLGYNKQYNRLSDEFGVSLVRCLIGI